MTKAVKRGLIIGWTVFAVAAVLASVGAYFISIDETGEIIRFVCMFAAGCIGVLWSVVYLVLVFIRMFRERREHIREQRLINLMAAEEDIDYEGIDNEVKEFLDNAVLPAGLKEFLADGNGKRKIKYPDGSSDYYEIDYLYPEEYLTEMNFHRDAFVNFRYYMDDNRFFISFADDESGHVHLILDYNDGGEPSVKVFDDEGDAFLPIAANFAEFLQRLE